MLRFDALERTGLRAGAISGRVDGDCVLGRSSEAARRAFMAGLELEADRLICPKQVHGAVVVAATTENSGQGAFDPENAIALADAIITDVPGLPIGITVADCVPVALYDPVRRAIGLAHAGREGTALQIAAATVRAMQAAYGCAPADLLAVVGPSAGPCCYEVSEELAAAFAAAGGPVQGRHLDLWGANAMQLTRAGVPASRISVSGICTICGTDFFSFRREKTTARNLGVLCL